MESFVIHLCDSFHGEVQQVLTSLDRFNVTVEFYPAFCGRPMMQNKDFDFSNPSKKHFLLGGVCLQKVSANEKKNVSVLRMENCFYLLLNNELVDYYIKDGAYLLTPGWLQNWQKRLKQWGFDKSTATLFFAESCKYILLLDTGVISTSRDHLKAFSEYIGKEVKLLPIGLDYFTARIETLLLQNVTKNSELAANGQIAEYAMALDLVGKLVKDLNEKEVVETILNTMNILFAPREIFFLSIQNSEEHKLYSGFMEEINNTEISKQMLAVEQLAAASKDGFSIPINIEAKKIGVIKLTGLAFPQYLDHYLNLAQFLSNACGLAIKNARAFEMLKESERKLETLMNNLPGIAYRCENDANWTMNYVSKAFHKITGFKESDVIRNNVMSFNDLIYPEDQQKVKSDINQALENHKSYEIEYRLLTKSKEIKWMWELGEGVWDHNKNLLGIEGFISDITIRKKNEESILRQQEHISFINRLLWHDVGNSLAVAHSGLRLFKKSSDEEMLSEADRHILKASQLINRMRQLTQTLSNEVVLKKVQLKPIAIKVASDYNFPIIVKGACEAMVDDTIQSVIDNLIGNAILHANASDITIEMSQDKGISKLNVTDDGKGIPDEVKARVFQKSFVYGETGHTGLGLFIVKKTIERYHGIITIADNKPQGTIFRIELKSGLEEK